VAQQMTIKKKFKGFYTRCSWPFLLFVISLAMTILYPQPLFANKVEYKQFKVYSNDKIGDEIKPILDAALSVVEKSELYDPNYKVDIFLAYNIFFNKLDDKVFGLGPSADYSLKKEIERFVEFKRKQTDSWVAVEEGECEFPEFYYKRRLMTEYLINVRKLTYDQVLEDKRSEEEIYAEMIRWTSK